MIFDELMIQSHATMHKTMVPSLGTLSQHRFPSSMESFQYLCDNIPSWIERLELLSLQVIERQAEFERLSRSSASSRGSLRRKQKTGSTESLRPNDNQDTSNSQSNDEPRFSSDAPLSTPTAPTTPISPHGYVNINPNSRRLFQDYREAARRKRKSASIISGASGPQKYRHRMSAIVYYDSNIQQGFEWVVRGVAGARNNLRKGKMATSYKARMASVNVDETPVDGDRTSISLRSRVPRFPRSSTPFSMDSISLEQFDIIDKDLETAQTLCEVGAHQFLRDADCSDELSTIRERFANCLRIAREGFELMKAEEEDDRKLLVEATPRNTSTTDRSTVVSAYSTTSDTKTTLSKTYTDSAMAIDIDNGTDIDLESEADIKEIEVDVGSVQVDSGVNGIEMQNQAVSQAVDQPNGTPDIPLDFDFSNGLIEVDETADDNSFHIDLSSFRRTRGL